jgi:NAD(P)-dependent dehydrogenase (short-subunit alcohol dehydrogenase family)
VNPKQGAEDRQKSEEVRSGAAIGGPARLIGRDGPISLAKFDQVIKINLNDTLHVLRAAVPVMMRNDLNAEGERGAIINISSGAAYEGQIGQIAYDASKAALIGMTMPLARELAGYGIRVVTVAPGRVRHTDLRFRSAGGEGGADQADDLPAPRAWSTKAGAATPRQRWGNTTRARRRAALPRVPCKSTAPSV